MTFSRNKILILLSIFVIIIGIFIYFEQNNKKYYVILSDKEYLVEIADSFGEREQGLSGRESLPIGTGLLFVFDISGNYGFWMKEMNFPIDIIWISSENKIVGLEKSLSPETFPKVYFPKSPALYVLEINSGESELLNLKIGDSVKFIKK